MRHNRRFAACIAVLTALLASDAVAQSSAENAAAAETLFSDAKKLMEEQKYAPACRKLEESQRLDPAPGTALNLAVCHEKEGKIATAWSEFKAAMVQARREGRVERENLARERIEAIEPQLPRLVIDVPNASRVAGLVVSRNGLALTAGAWNTALPVDPGEVRIEANAPNFKGWKTVVKVDLAKTERVTIPKLAPAPVPPPSAAPASKPPVQQTRNTRPAGLVLGGVGLVAIGVGSYFGVRTLQKKSDADDGCPVIAGQEQCTRAAVKANDDARTSAWISNIGIGVGIAAVGIGTYLFLSSGPSRSEAPQPSASRPVVQAAVLPGGAFASVGTRF